MTGANEKGSEPQGDLSDPLERALASIHEATVNHGLAVQRSTFLTEQMVAMGELNAGLTNYLIELQRDISKKYQDARVQFARDVARGAISTDSLVGTAAALDPPASYSTPEGVVERRAGEPNDLRKVRVDALLELSRCVVAGQPTLITDGHTYIGGTPRHNDFAVKLVETPDSEQHFCIGITGDGNAPFSLRNAVAVGYKLDARGNAIPTAYPNLHVVAGAEAVRSFALGHALGVADTAHQLSAEYAKLQSRLETMSGEWPQTDEYNRRYATAAKESDEVLAKLVQARQEITAVLNAATDALDNFYQDGRLPQEALEQAREQLLQHILAINNRVYKLHAGGHNDVVVASRAYLALFTGKQRHEAIQAIVDRSNKQMATDGLRPTDQHAIQLLLAAYGYTRQQIKTSLLWPSGEDPQQLFP